MHYGDRVKSCSDASLRWRAANVPLLGVGKSPPGVKPAAPQPRPWV